MQLPLLDEKITQVFYSFERRKASDNRYSTQLIILDEEICLSEEVLYTKSKSALEKFLRGGLYATDKNPYYSKSLVPVLPLTTF
jgi:hypothetical protein